MRILSRNPDALVFELDPHECRLLVFLLSRYPVLDASYHQVSRPEHREAFAAAQELLTEHLTEAQSTNRARIEQFIRTRLVPPSPPGPSAATSGEKPGSAGTPPPGQLRTLTLTLTLAEVDWLLQIVNDVRVGSWVRLGCPESGAKTEVPPSKESDFSAMELGGLVQMILLEALGRD